MAERGLCSRREADRLIEKGIRFVEIGGNDRYVALCRKHFSEALA